MKKADLLRGCSSRVLEDFLRETAVSGADAKLKHGGHLLMFLLL